MKFALGLLVGLAIGAGIALVIAPGEAAELPSGVAELIGRGKAILESAIDEGRRVADDQRQTLQSQATN
ncbi:MAG: YtxH domain-containing protein [Vulcanimicrobiaceae bacterium]|jgi:gas vesicle protein